jgi:hypothetical protein
MPKVGEIFRLSEGEYLFGTGPLVARVVRVLRETEFRGESWWEVEARCRVPGTIGQAFERSLYVRDDAKPAPPSGEAGS